MRRGVGGFNGYAEYNDEEEWEEMREWEMVLMGSKVTQNTMTGRKMVLEE